MPKTETTAEAEAIWTGRCRVYWRADAFGHKDCALFIGRLHVGSLMHYAPHGDKPWRAWLMTDDDGKQIGWFPTQQEAQDALVDAAIVEILK